MFTVFDATQNITLPASGKCLPALQVINWAQVITYSL